MKLRRLGPDDESVIERLATQGAPVRVAELLADDRTIFLVAFDGAEPIGFDLAYELLRRHGDAAKLFVYEVEVAKRLRRRGVGTALMRELRRFACGRGIRSGWVLTDRANVPAMELYRTVGGLRPHEETMWEFEYGER